MSTITDPKILGMLSTALSALIAALSYYMKTRQERLKTTKVVLYLLLELRHQLSASLELNSWLAQSYATHIEAALTRRQLALSGEELREITQVLGKAFRQFGKAQLVTLQNEVATPFSKALLELARDEPLLAFRLKGQDVLADVPKLVTQLAEEQGMTLDSADQQIIAKRWLHELEDRVWKDRSDELLKSIRMIALECGWSTYLGVSLHFWWRSQRHHGRRANTEREMGDLADRLIQQILEQPGSLPPRS